MAKAKLDFEKVDAQPIPDVAATAGCVQSNAAALPVTRPEERYLVYYRKGYCELFGGVLTGASDNFQAAVRDFTEAVASWPKKAPTRPPVGLRALIEIAKLEQGRMADSYPDLARDLEAVIAEQSCSPTPVMAATFCKALIETARTWLAWLAYRKNDFTESARVLEPLAQPDRMSPWAIWISGRLAQQQNRAAEAASLYEKTLAAWSAAERSTAPDVVTLLGPKLDVGSIHFQLALVDYSLQRYDSAITHFDIALKISPRNSYAIFLRARSKEALHLNAPAMDDYAQAAQTARGSNDAIWNVGQAHYYRGLLLYQARDYTRAEGEFSNALGGRLGEVAQADVSAWQAMAAVAGAGCKSSVDLLESAAKAASSQFPKAQADAMIFDCRMKRASTLDQYLALEKLYATRLDAAKLGDLHTLIANAYADQGVAAEDRKDPYSAVIAYRNAIDWNPKNSKAHFNLGAIYIEDKRYNLAEAEYRALVEADSGDYEADYWLGQSILAQHPTPERAAAACGLLQQSLLINDPEKKAQFAKALTVAKCP
jgi:tetratricopeptide (TPR) repeat protein